MSTGIYGDVKEKKRLQSLRFWSPFGDCSYRVWFIKVDTHGGLSTGVMAARGKRYFFYLAVC